jgi:hypothetical protein
MTAPVSFFWIGSKPLPNEEIKTLSAYASSGKTPIILWADNPDKLTSQLVDQNLSALLKSGHLQILPVSDLFIKEESQTKLAKCCDLLLDSLQSREKVGEGNLGTRVDILKVQAAYKIGGVVIDFDTAAQLIIDNENVDVVLDEFNYLTAQERLLYNTDTIQPDLIISPKMSDDSQLLRENLIQIVKWNGKHRTSKITEAEYLPLDENALLSDPLLQSKSSFISQHDTMISPHNFGHHTKRPFAFQNIQGLHSQV